MPIIAVQRMCRGLEGRMLGKGRLSLAVLKVKNFLMYQAVMEASLSCVSSNFYFLQVTGRGRRWSPTKPVAVYLHYPSSRPLIQVKISQIAKKQERQTHLICGFKKWNSMLSFILRPYIHCTRDDVLIFPLDLSAKFLKKPSAIASYA